MSVRCTMTGQAKDRVGPDKPDPRGELTSSAQPLPPFVVGRFTRELLQFFFRYMFHVDHADSCG